MSEPTVGEPTSLPASAPPTTAPRLRGTAAMLAAAGVGIAIVLTLLALDRAKWPGHRSLVAAGFLIACARSLPAYGTAAFAGAVGGSLFSLISPVVGHKGFPAAALTGIVVSGLLVEAFRGRLLRTRRPWLPLLTGLVIGLAQPLVSVMCSRIFEGEFDAAAKITRQFAAHGSMGLLGGLLASLFPFRRVARP